MWRTTLHSFIVFVLTQVALPALAEPMTFIRAGNGGNCNGCEWIAAQGEITTETPDVFRDFLATNGKPYHIAFNSLGGSLVAGIELGELIRETGATTMIGTTSSRDEQEMELLENTGPGVCASACVFAFMGGIQRWVGDKDLLGVHQFYSTDDEAMDSTVVQALAGLTLIHSLRMGVDARVIVAASGTSPNDIYWFDREEMVAYRLDTSGSTTEPWRIEPYKLGLILTTTHYASARRSVDVTLFCRANTRRWHMLISEQNELYATQLLGDTIISFSGNYPARPVLSVGADKYAVGAKDVEFQRVFGDRISISVYLPDHIYSAAGQQISFDPNLSRVFGSLLYASVELPMVNWLQAAGNNCI